MFNKSGPVQFVLTAVSDEWKKIERKMCAGSTRKNERNKKKIPSSSGKSPFLDLFETD